MRREKLRAIGIRIAAAAGVAAPMAVRTAVTTNMMRGEHGCAATNYPQSPVDQPAHGAIVCGYCEKVRHTHECEEKTEWETLLNLLNGLSENQGSDDRCCDDRRNTHLQLADRSDHEHEGEYKQRNDSRCCIYLSHLDQSTTFINNTRTHSFVVWVCVGTCR